MSLPVCVCVCLCVAVLLNSFYDVTAITLFYVVLISSLYLRQVMFCTCAGREYKNVNEILSDVCCMFSE